MHAAREATEQGRGCGAKGLMARGQGSGVRGQESGVRSQSPPLTTHRSPLTPNALRAFTLIELLVVISIIALLIGILLPALGSARTTARLSQCLANVRSLGQAVEFYGNDNRQMYPGGTFLTVEVNWYNWSGEQGTVSFFGSDTAPENRALNSYLSSNSAAARCPLDKGDAQSAGSDPAGLKYGTSYTNGDRSLTHIANQQKAGRNGFWYPEAHRASEVLTPSKKLIMADLVLLANRLPTNSSHHWHNKTEPLEANIAFADGHAKGVKRKTGADANPTATQVLTNTQIDTWRTTTEYY